MALCSALPFALFAGSSTGFFLLSHCERGDNPFRPERHPLGEKGRKSQEDCLCAAPCCLFIITRAISVTHSIRGTKPVLRTFRRFRCRLRLCSWWPCATPPSEPHTLDKRRLNSQAGFSKADRRLLELLQRPARPISPPTTLLGRNTHSERTEIWQSTCHLPQTGKQGTTLASSWYVACKSFQILGDGCGTVFPLVTCRVVRLCVTWMILRRN